jgi:DNA-binding NtrC family response regulator
MVNARLADVRILVVASGAAHHTLNHCLNSLGISPVLVTDVAELANQMRREQVYEVVMLPAALPDADWWGIWAELALLDMRPEILVYAKEASFQLWSSVLEAGGFDVIVEPFANGKLKTVLMRAARSFRIRLRNGSAHA